jgi:hypothetical protein
MKLRIRANTIRLRLSQSEIKTLEAGNSVEASLFFEPKFKYKTQVQDIDKIACKYEDNSLTVSIPSQEVAVWTGSEQVGIRGIQMLENGDEIKILVEKDFRCLVPRGEDEDLDTFAHPKKHVE